MAIVSRAEAANIFGVTPDTLSTWAKAGMPFIQKGGRNKEWKFDSRALIEWKIEQDVLRAVGEHAAETLDDIKKRKLKAEASIAEMEAARKRGEVVLVEDVLRENVAAILATKARLRNVPARVAPLIVGERDESIIKEEILREIDDALRELANGFTAQPGDSEADAGASVPVLPTAAEA